MIRRVAVSLAVLVMCAAFATPAAAQQGADEPENDLVEPSAGQKTLNDEGVRALIKGDYERAVSLLTESLALGDLNITYLNLGRAYQKLGKCREAQDALLNAVSAPPVKEPKQRIVDAKADQYLSELEETCGDELDRGPPPLRERSAVQWGLIGGGAAVMVFGGIGVVRGASAAPGDFERDSSGTITEPTQKSAFEDRRTANTWTTIGISALTVGAACAGLGAYYLLTGDTAESQPTASVGPDGRWQLGWSIRF